MCHPSLPQTILTSSQEARSIIYPRSSRTSSINAPSTASSDQYPGGFGAAPLRPSSIMSQEGTSVVGAGIHRPLSPRGGRVVWKRDEVVELANERPQMRQVPLVLENGSGSGGLNGHA